jgi:uncharacterized membrane protein YkvA (DUF1232 family)
MTAPPHGSGDEPRETRTWRELVVETALLIPNFVMLIYRLMRDPRVPVRGKLVVGAMLGYLVSPLDVIPDFIPVVGQIDDVLLIAFAIRHLIEGAGREVVLEYWGGQEDAFELLEAVIEWGADLVPAPVRRFLA